MSLDDVLRALRITLEREPRNGGLWLHYAELLEKEGREDEALEALRTAAEIPEVRTRALLALSPLLRRRGSLAEALIRVETALERGEDAELRAELGRIVEARGEGAGEGPLVPAPVPSAESSEAQAPAEPMAARAGDSVEDDDDWASQFDWGDLRVTFDDVVGLDDVKRQIHLRIVAPFKNPEIYEAFGRTAGGGILLYGPPGCGKTYIARATAGELGARFVSVSLHDVLDKFYGETEKLVHKLFEDARRSKPTVLFFDEFDALGTSRGRSDSQFWKTLVNALLAEMDGVEGANADVLICAATNLPWNVDTAFRRPGRFDRLLFVPPPDAQGREALLRKHLSRLPGGTDISLKRLVRDTELFSGADIRGLCERASEQAIDRSLDTGQVHAIQEADVKRTLKESRSTILEWMSTARNYARYSNEGGQFDELVAFLKLARRW